MSTQYLLLGVIQIKSDRFILVCYVSGLLKGKKVENILMTFNEKKKERSRKPKQIM